MAIGRGLNSVAVDEILAGVMAQQSTIRAALFVILLIPSIASADVRLYLLSQPGGASVFQGFRQLDGTLVYQPMASGEFVYKTPRRWTECLRVNPIKVRWISGAEAVVEDLQLCPAQGKKQQFVFMRPEGVDGALIDAQYALALLQAQTANTPPPPPAVYPTYTPPTTTHCTTQVIGYQIFTRCTQY